MVLQALNFLVALKYLHFTLVVSESKVEQLFPIMRILGLVNKSFAELMYKCTFSL